MEKVMNDQQFDALLNSLSQITYALEEIDARLVMLTSAYVQINDPKGWEKASEESDAEEVADFDSQGLS